MVDRIEETFQVQVHAVAVAFFCILLHSLHSIVCATVGTKAEAVVAEQWFIFFHQHLAYRLLDEAVNYGWDAELALLAVVFRYLYPSYGGRFVFARLNLLDEFA